jgi:uncharacterized spore protein YtfJ
MPQYYAARTNGLWNVTTTWNSASSLGAATSSWGAATTYPGQGATDDVVFINGKQVGLNVTNFTIGSMTNNGFTQGSTVILDGGTVTCSIALTAYNVTSTLISGSSVNTTAVLQNTTTSSLTITGTVIAGTNAPGIVSTNAAALVTINGKIVNTNGYLGVLSQRLILTASATQAAQWVYQDSTNNNVTFGTSAGSANYPDVSFVRAGVDNGSGIGTGTFVVPAPSNVRNTITYDTSSNGTMVVPSYLDVRSGVPVDSGSGAIIMPIETQVQFGVTFDSGSSKSGSYDGVSAFWGYSTASMSVGSIGALITQSLDVRVGTITGSLVAELDNTASISNTVRRIQNAATVQTTGDQLSSYNT